MRDLTSPITVYMYNEWYRKVESHTSTKHNDQKWGNEWFAHTTMVGPETCR
jgi:hypothetical protein